MRGPPVTFRSMSLTRTDPALILFKNVPKEKLFQIAVSVYQKGLASKKIYIIALKSFFWGIFFSHCLFSWRNELFFGSGYLLAKWMHGWVTERQGEQQLDL